MASPRAARPIRAECGLVSVSADLEGCEAVPACGGGGALDADLGLMRTAHIMNIHQAD